MALSFDWLKAHFLVGSTLVEGSTLSEKDAAEVLQGRTVSGHNIRDVRELVNHRHAAQWMIKKIADDPVISMDTIVGLHRQLFLGVDECGGQFKTHQNFTFRTDGSKHAYAKPSEVVRELTSWISKFNVGHAQVGPSQGLAELYYAFENIHPFEDGNGRIGRLLATHWLYMNHGKVFAFYASDKVPHLRALEAANSGDLSELVTFFLKRLRDLS